MIDKNPTPLQTQVLAWIHDYVNLHDYIEHYKGTFKGVAYDSDLPPKAYFKNNFVCKQFAPFIRQTLLNRLKTGAIVLKGRVNQCHSPHLVMPLTVDPTKPRLCYDARYLNLWMCDVPFTLDSLSNLPRYVHPNSYQTVLDDKSGYDHILLQRQGWHYFGIQWGGWYFLHVSLPFGWKISPYIYHTTGLFSSNYFRTIGIPCSLYIDDRHNGQLCVQFTKGVYATLPTLDERNCAAACFAVFLIAYSLIRLGYFLNLEKSILQPTIVVPYLGFLCDSFRQVFALIQEKRNKFIDFIKTILKQRTITLPVLQRLVGKCVSLSRAIPGAMLFTRVMSTALSI